MDGVYFLLSIVATGLVMWWVIKNDRVGPGEKTTGLFAMRDDTDPPDQAKGRASRHSTPVQPAQRGPARR